MDCIDAVWEKEAPNDLKTERPKCDTDIIRKGDVRFFREEDDFSSVYVFVYAASRNGP